jgi:hypothetical protein
MIRNARTVGNPKVYGCVRKIHDTPSLAERKAALKAQLPRKPEAYNLTQRP